MLRGNQTAGGSAVGGPVNASAVVMVMHSDDTEKEKHRSGDATRRHDQEDSDVEDEKAPLADSIDRASAPAAPSTLGLLPSFGLGVIYCGVGVTYTIAIRTTVMKGIKYDAAAVVFMTELAKLVASVILGFAQSGVCTPVEVLCSPQRRSLWRESRAYAMSSLIYAVYNNMTFLNLGNFDAGTWSVFMQARIGVTGVLFTVLLDHALSLRHWASLGLLTSGLVLKSLSPTLQVDYRVVLILVQAGLSALAGVYNEYVLKQHKSLSIHVQNFFMYFYALAFNIIIGIVVRPEVIRQLDFGSLVNSYVLLIIASGAITGIAAAFILKFINSIVKTFAAAVEVLLVPVVGAMFLGDLLSLQDVVAIVVVVTAIGIYSTVGRGSGSLVYFQHGRVVVKSA